MNQSIYDTEVQNDINNLHRYMYIPIIYKKIQNIIEANGILHTDEIQHFISIIPSSFLKEFYEMLFDFTHNLQSIPVTYHTLNMYMNLIDDNVNILQELPLHCFDEDVFVRMIKLDADFIYAIPEKYRTIKIYTEAITTNIKYLCLIKDNSILVDIVKINPYILYKLPEPQITKEICVSSIKESLISLQFVPKYYINDILLELIIEGYKSKLFDIIRITPSFQLRIPIEDIPYSIFI